eukprot:scaffold126060_cov57-Phaeocystis_antarctica.AAC.1
MAHLHAVHRELALHGGGGGEGEGADEGLEALRAKEHREEDAGVHEVDLDPRGAVQVILSAHRIVGQHLVKSSACVSLRCLLEHLLGLGVVGVLIGVQLEGLLIVGLLDLVGARVVIDAKQLVEGRVLGLGPAAAACAAVSPRRARRALAAVRLVHSLHLARVVLQAVGEPLALLVVPVLAVVRLVARLDGVDDAAAHLHRPHRAARHGERHCREEAGGEAQEEALHQWGYRLGYRLATWATQATGLVTAWCTGYTRPSQ